MGARLRRAALTSHVVCSVGWIGAVVAFLAVAVAGLVDSDEQRVEAAYLALETVTWYAIVPLCLASLVTGVVQSLGTTWGLVRHHWVLLKLILTAAATVLLFVHTQPIEDLAEAAAAMSLRGADVVDGRVQLIVTASAAVVVLGVMTVLSIYKPRGTTRWAVRSVGQGTPGGGA